MPKGWFLAHPYPMPPNFTGRAVELKMLDDWLALGKDRLFVLCALGGFGKSALTWQWITTRVNPAEWMRLVWWSFYEGDASFEHFIEETLKYLKLEIPSGKRTQVDELLKAMQSQKILLVIDGFERALRAYSSMNAAYQGDEESNKEDNQFDCVDINAEHFLRSVCVTPGIQSKILMTTRLTPRAVLVGADHYLLLQGCHVTELQAMQKEDVVEFFKKQKIKGTHAEIEAACEPYGYHPLSLRLLAGRILNDFDTPGDIVTAQKFRIDGDLKQHQHHVLEVSYNSLPKHEQKLLSTIACFRSPVELKTLESVAENKDSLENDLHDLVERGLLHFDGANKKFDLHPIVRRYAYESLTAPDRTAAHIRMIDYFAAVPKPKKIENLEDLTPVIELYHHMVRAGNLDEALKLFRDRLHKSLYYQFGAYQTSAELLGALFPDGEDKTPRLNEESNQAWTLNSLANAYSQNGEPRRAAALWTIAIPIAEKLGEKQNIAIGWGNVGQQQCVIGALGEAERNQRRRIDLCLEIADEYFEATDHSELGLLLSYHGTWQEAEKELDSALKLFEKQHSIQSEGIVWSYRSVRYLLMARECDQRSATSYQRSAIKSANRALELADETARTRYPHERDYVRTHWLLGAAYRASDDLVKAEIHLSESLRRCRANNIVEHEADILLEIAKLRHAQGDRGESLRLAQEALVITERCGYVLQGADVHLWLTELALEGLKAEGEKGLSDKEAAHLHAREALRLAHCDNGPPYYYKVAYEEAERLLERLR
jgi:tetratricopeptide (TPR) repeat protein